MPQPDLDAIRWWKPRQPGEMTAPFLTRVLRECNLDSMAEKAEKCHYDDYFCPPDIDDGLNMLHLVSDLRAASIDPRTKGGPTNRHRIKCVHDAAKLGEFDGTKQESDMWAESPDGQSVMSELIDSTQQGSADSAPDDDDDPASIKFIEDNEGSGHGAT